MTTRPTTPAATGWTVPTILLGALLLSWPAILNGYPIVFSDTYGYLEQGIMPQVAWDKPWIYGPLMVPIHWRISLWPIVALQALLLSTMLWLTQRTVLPHPRRTAHLAVATLLAIGSAAPWFAALILPDNFTPIVALGLFILAFGPGRLGRKTLIAVFLITTITIAAHFSHLILAAACIATLALLRWRTAWRPALPLLAALTMILATNILGHGIVGISPYGSVFALARLVADGPAADYIRAACPHTDYYVCGWKDRLPTDSDEFLWAPDAPMSTNPKGAMGLAPEAAEIVRATILAYPARVFVSSALNTGRQLLEVRLGDTLIPDYLDLTVRDTLQTYFRPAETARFDAGLQARGTLKPVGEHFNALDQFLLVVGALGTVFLATTHWRQNRPLASLAVLTLMAVLANAFATGALSGPHDRYQARIAWLVLLPPTLFTLSCLRRRARTSI